MKKRRNAYVYIMASKSGTLYTGMTSNLLRRVHEHKTDYKEGFTKKYQCHKLVYFEYSDYIIGAIEREKQIKRWNRKKKESLIRIQNPTWKDLAEDWYSEELLYHKGIPPFR